MRRRPPVLPNDGRMHRLSRRPIPDDHGFALIGDPDGGHIAGTRARLAQHFDGDGHLAGQDLHRVVLNPSRLRIVLLELLLRHGRDRAGLVKQYGAGTGRTLVQGKDIAHAFSLLSAISQSRRAGVPQGDGLPLPLVAERSLLSLISVANSRFMNPKQHMGPVLLLIEWPAR